MEIVSFEIMTITKGNKPKTSSRFWNRVDVRLFLHRDIGFELNWLTLRWADGHSYLPMCVVSQPILCVQCLCIGIYVQLGKQRHKM